jgi:hypothetical protein
LRYTGRLPRHFLLRPDGGRNSLARGVAAARSRSRRGNGVLDGWIGKVPAGLAPIPGLEKPISPTALETFARCPFRYFLGHVLKVGELEKPEEVVTIEPATIGNIVHEILERSFQSVSAGGSEADDWTEDDREQLRRISREVFDKYESAGRTGKSLTWKAEQARIERDLDLLLDKEIEERRVSGFRFRQAEAPFGMAPTRSQPNPLPPAHLILEDGSVVNFRGKVDRVDVGPSGELAVIDYKTGSTRRYEPITATNPMVGGKFLQLPVYALAFKDQSTGPVTARYWFISEQAGFGRRDVVLDDASMKRFSQTVGTLIGTMRDGYFPAVPGGEVYFTGDTYENCMFCPYDQVCPSNQRTEAWDAASRDPGLEAFVALADVSGPEDGDD